MLRHGFGRVSGSIAPLDPALREIIFVQIVCACCADADKF